MDANTNRTQPSNETYVFLNDKLLTSLRTVVDKLVYKKYEDRQGFFYAILDRLDHAVDYLEKHSTKPGDDEAYIIFIVYSKMIVEAVDALGNEVGFSPTRDECKFFCKYWEVIPVELGENETITDDDFFRYLRALSFAHCLGADKGNVLAGRRETHYSPWVCVNDIEFPSRVGVRIYTNKNADEKSLLVEFDDLKQYVKSRYEEIGEITKCIANEIKELDRTWKNDVIKSFGDSDRKLAEIIRVAKNRRIPTYDLERARLWRSLSLSEPLNASVVGKFRKELDEEIEKAIFHFNILHAQPALDGIAKFVHFDVHAHLGKLHDLQAIFGDLNSRASKERRDYSLITLLNWAKGFPSKWVTIREDMSLDELQMLAMVACYFEAREKKCSGKHESSGAVVQDEEKILESLWEPIPDEDVARANAFIKTSTNQVGEDGAEGAG